MNSSSSNESVGCHATGTKSPIPLEHIEAALDHINATTTSTTSELFDSFAKKVGKIGAAMAETCLQQLVTHLSLHHTTAGVVFADLDSDGSGELDPGELHIAMENLGITMSDTAIKNVMLALDNDGDGHINIMEMAAIIDKFRRSRREFAGTALACVPLFSPVQSFKPVSTQSGLVFDSTMTSLDRTIYT
jgi:Ca2+-binding EF-hand superfamily protein